MKPYSAYNDLRQVSQTDSSLDADRPIAVPSVSSLGGDWDRTLVVLDGRALGRECLTQSLTTHHIRMYVAAVGSMQDWRSAQELHPPLAAILFNTGGRRFTDQDTANELTRLVSEFKSVPVVVLADTDDITQILKALECGARGYIPSTVGIDVCIEAINLAIAGGIFVPASSLTTMRQLLGSDLQETKPISTMFTPRQAAVVEALRKGKANKIIAYELDLCESTVKVHIRNIMKKLNATNRTEVAYKINSLFRPEIRPS
jgi:DNA-binding NarL/FixJ family response regulator